MSAACNARDAEDFAAVGDKADVVQLGHTLAVPAGQPGDRQPRLRIDRLRSVNIQRNLASDHHFGQLAFIGFRCLDRRDMLSFAQDRDHIGDFHHLIQLMRDDDDRLAVLFHRAKYLKQLLRLLRRQHCGRLVQNQDVRAAIQNLENLDSLLFGDRHFINLFIRIDFKPISLTDCFNLFGNRPAIELSLFL